MIFYFTGSGNSQFIAEETSKTLNENLVSIGNSIKIQKYISEQKYNYTIDKNEYLGFIFPTYCFGIPSIVNDFISNLDLENYDKQYSFAIINYGSNPGDSADQIINALKKKGIYLNSIFKMKMPGNCILLYDPPQLNKQKIIIENAKIKMKEINLIIKNKENKYNTKNENKNLLYQIINKILKKASNRVFTSNKFYSLDSCIHCSLCVTKCPLNIIKLDSKSKKPIWESNSCGLCLACINNCPVKAIQYNKITQKRKRYNINNIR